VGVLVLLVQQAQLAQQVQRDILVRLVILARLEIQVQQVVQEQLEILAQLDTLAQRVILAQQEIQEQEETLVRRETRMIAPTLLFQVDKTKQVWQPYLLPDLCWLFSGVRQHQTTGFLDLYYLSIRLCF
jgi:hypothetical protein